MTRIFALSLVALAACRPDGPSATKAGEFARACDAGCIYGYVTTEGPTKPIEPMDASLRPTLQWVAGLPGARGDLDGIGEDARIGLVSGMARVGDAIVFADEGNGSIRRFVPASGAVETVVRLPVPSGGVSLPAFVAFDGARTLYVTDRAAHVVYALDLTSRALSVFAGKMNVRGDRDGALDDAAFDTPTGIAFDGAHALYVGDVGNRHIRRIDIAAREVSTLSTRFSQVWGLCFDGAALYADDELTEALFRVDVRTGEATHVVGSNRFGYAGFVDGPPPHARLHGPRGIACTPDAVYVAERSNALVRRWDRHAKRLDTIAGTANMLGWRDGAALDALFSDLQSVLVWDEHTIMLGDEGGVRQLDLTTHMVSTVAGRPNQGLIDLAHLEENALVRPQGVAFVPSEGAAFIAECGTATVQRVDLATGRTRTLVGDAVMRGFVDGFGSEARFSCVSSIAADLRGNLFVGDRYNHALRGVRIATRQVSTLAGTTSKCGNDDGPFETATLCDPVGICAGEHGELFVADASTHTIRRVDLVQRSVTTLAGKAFERGHADGVGQEARFASPASLAYAHGTLYVADRDNDALRMIDVKTLVTSTLPTHVERPSAIALSGDDLLVGDRRSLRRVSSAGTHRGGAERLIDAGEGLRLGSENPRVHAPTAIANVGAGDALVVDGLENTLLRLAY